jgi:hypothetical protein
MSFQNFNNNMIKLSFAAIVLFTSIHAFSQKKLFDTLKIDATTKIIGRYPQYDKSKTYEKYNFIIEDTNEIAEFISKLKLGNEIQNSTEDPSFTLTVIKSHNEIGSWTINPTMKSAMTNDGHTYEFDLNQIAKLNQQHPFKYYHEIKVFGSRAEYERYLAEQKNNVNFLFDYAPQFKYEGSFEIEFPKNSTFPHPKAISDFLTPYILKIVKKGEYSLGYTLNSKNLNNQNQYTITIQGARKLFEQLKIDNLTNEDWKPTVEDAYFFYKSH